MDQIYLDFTIKSAATVEDSDGLYIEGYASLFDDEPDRHGEIIDRNAFTNAVKAYMRNPVITLTHDDDRVIGKVVDYRIDDRGLWVRGYISKAAHEAYQAIKDGLYRAFSWKGWAKRVANKIIEITDLHHVAVVGVPAKATATFTVAAKSADFQLYTGSIATGEGMGEKAGRIQARRNVQRLQSILAEVQAMLDEIKDSQANGEKNGD